MSPELKKAKKKVAKHYRKLEKAVLKANELEEAETPAKKHFHFTVVPRHVTSWDFPVGD